MQKAGLDHSKEINNVSATTALTMNLCRHLIWSEKLMSTVQPGLGGHVVCSWGKPVSCKVEAPLRLTYNRATSEMPVLSSGR